MTVKRAMLAVEGQQVATRVLRNTSITRDYHRALILVNRQLGARCSSIAAMAAGATPAR